MKKPLLIAALLLSGLALKAQTVTLKYGYSPKSLYKSACNAVAIMDMQGPDKSAVKMNMDMRMSFEAKTQARKTDGSFPLTLQYTDFAVKINVNGAEQPMPDKNPLIGQVVYAQCDKAGKPRIDSLAGSPDEQKKAMVMQMINQFQDQMKFPEKPMKVGESATIDVPLNAPGLAQGMNMNMNTKATYKLISVKNGLAYFDVVQDLKMDMSKDDKAFTISANGNGKMVYNIAKQFPVEFISNMDMSFNIPGAGAQAMKMKMNMDVKTEIAAN